MSALNFLEPSEEIINEVRGEFGLDARRIKEAVDGIKEWLEYQPHLPHDEDDGRLERRLIKCKNNMEKCKDTLDLYYSLRTLTPELMTGWDISQPWFQNTTRHGFACVMKKLTPQLDRVTVKGFTSADTKDLSAADLLKSDLLILEIRMNEDYYNKDIVVMDLKNSSLAHVTKFTPSLIKKFALCYLRGYNTRMRSMHFINVPPYAIPVTSFIKSILKPKIAARMHVYGNDFTDLYNHVPKECLPTEYGGEGGTIKENTDLVIEKGKTYRKWFLKQEKLKSDESKRPEGAIKSSEIFGFEGSFRTLSID